MIWASVMIAVYPVGVLITYYVLLRHVRSEIQRSKGALSEAPIVRSQLDTVLVSVRRRASVQLGILSRQGQ